MKTEDLLSKLTSLGVHLRATDRRLLYRPRNAVPTDLLELLSLKKDNVIEWLNSTADTTGAPPSTPVLQLVGKVVSTPQGPGRLIAALPEFVAVSLLGRSQELRNFLPCEIEALDSTIDGSD